MPPSRSPPHFLAKTREPSPPRAIPRPGRITHAEGIESDQSAPKAKPQARHESPLQFAAAPRFGSSKYTARTQQQEAVPTQGTAILQSFRHASQIREHIDETSKSDEDDTMLLGNGAPETPLNSKSTSPRFGFSTSWTDDLTVSPKRRRFNSDDANSSATSPLPSMNELLHESTSSITPHFKSSKAPTNTSFDKPANIHQGPTFLRPSPSSSEPSEPLPEAFSPHHRGRKFVPGGLASTLQQLVIETGQLAMQSRKIHGPSHSEELVDQITIGQVVGSRPSTAFGRKGTGEDVFILFIDGSDGQHPKEVQAGQVVNIRAPSWNIELDARKWVVAVEWKICDKVDTYIDI